MHNARTKLPDCRDHAACVPVSVPTCMCSYHMIRLRLLLCCYAVIMCERPPNDHGTPGYYSDKPLFTPMIFYFLLFLFILTITAVIELCCPLCTAVVLRSIPSNESTRNIFWNTDTKYQVHHNHATQLIYTHIHCKKRCFKVYY